MYGVLACAHLPTNNAVAANQITATARAGAFAMILTLNGLQVITDGCTYRRDQIPACTFSECLRRQPDYPLRPRGGGLGHPVLRPGRRPERRRRLHPRGSGPAPARSSRSRAKRARRPSICTTWSTRRRAARRPSTRWPATAAARTPSAHVRMTGPGRCRRWRCAGTAPRARRRSGPGIVETYPSDHLGALAPVTEDEVLLRFKEARQKARLALNRGLEEVLLPVGPAVPEGAGLQGHQALRVRMPDSRPVEGAQEAGGAVRDQVREWAGGPRAAPGLRGTA